MVKIEDNKIIFILGTDTNSGKTISSIWLTYKLRALYWKPISCGINDAEYVQKILGKQKIIPSYFSFKAPLSPHIAAEMENKKIDSISIPRAKGMIVAEGAGGVMTPLRSGYYFADLARDLNAEVIISSMSSVGCICRSLQAFEAAIAHKCRVIGFFLHGLKDDMVISEIEFASKLPVIAQSNLLNEDPLDYIVIERNTQIRHIKSIMKYQNYPIYSK